MTNFIKVAPHNDEDPTNCADDGDTSFEIDEPDDEEEVPDAHDGLTLAKDCTAVTPSSIRALPALGELCTPLTMNVQQTTYDASTTAAAAAAASKIDEKARSAHLESSFSYAVPVLTMKHERDADVDVDVFADDDDDDDDAGNQSDSSLESHTGSSTPTTADVADITTIVANTSASASPARHAKQKRQQHTPSPHAMLGITKVLANPVSAAEDSLSASIATTTTEIDLDAVPSVSPNTAHMLALYARGALLQHPSAAYAETQAAMSSASGGDTATSNSKSHKRTLSSSSYRSIASQHPSQQPSEQELPPPVVQLTQPSARFFNWIRALVVLFKTSGIGEPSVYHALVVIFLEFFAWGLLAMPVITVLNQTFPDHTFLMNGLVMGIKGILSFLSAPLIGALSDIWGRKFFLLITVFFTCAPIPLMTINTWWFFAMISISGVFAVTFSVVFAYVADVTTVEERSRAYGLVSATFAASLVISPALGALLMEVYSDTLVVALATAIAVLDVFFILVAVPESLPEKIRPSSWGAPISWEQADPFAALRKVGTDHTVLMQCVTVLLSYLPEAGQYSCIFVYLKLKMGFNSMEVAIFIATVGILSISVQVTLGYLMRVLGAKRTIILGLILEMTQLLWYGFGTETWMMWAAGVLAALGSITYPAISAFVSIHSNADQQGAVQGMVTGMRGLCNGLGPAMFGVIFYLFNVDLNDSQSLVGGNESNNTASSKLTQLMPGPPFAFGALMVVIAILVAIYIPDSHVEVSRVPNDKKRVSLDVQYEIERGGVSNKSASSPLAPLMRSDSLAQL